jgi:putative ABC transport system permease protein
VKVQLDANASAAADTSEAARAAQLARYGAVLEELRQRVAAEPGVAGVTFAERLPRLNHREAYLDVDGLTADTAAEASFMLIDPSYFEVLEAPIIAGRAFVPADAQIVDAPAVIVDQQFVDQVLQGRSAVGRRVRLKERPRADGKHYVGPWHEIVGVARELGMTDAYEQLPLAGIYFPADLMRSGTMHMIVHATGNPLSLGPRIREITAAANPMLRLSEFQRLDQVADPMLWIIRMWLRASLMLAAITVLLSLAGIYAVLSFTVSRRTREIGVRVALGASRRRLVASIFRRPLTHVTLGVLAGGAIIVFMAFLMSQGDGGMANAVGGATIGNIALLLGYMTLMFAVCLLACVVPTRRALKVEPTEALRAE